jgi:hypothetical protein
MFAQQRASIYQRLESQFHKLEFDNQLKTEELLFVKTHVQSNLREQTHLS